MSWTTLHVPRLNYDALIAIVGSASFHTVTVMMRACRFLYHEGAKALLERVVFLSDEASFLSFLNFITAEDGIRVRHFRRLKIWQDIDEPDISSPLASAFVQLLQTHRPPIEYLVLEPADKFLRSHPGLPQAFASLTSLRILHFTSVGEHSLAMLETLQSPLTYANLVYELDEDEWMDPTVEDVNPIFLFGRAQDSLKELRIGRLYGTEEALKTGLPPHTFPYVHSLVFEDAMELAIRPYVHAFPNLADLSFEMEYNEFCAPEAAMARHLVRYEEERVANRAAQQMHGTWGSLRTFSGHVFGLYLLALTCTVEDVHLTFDGESYEWLRVALSDARPSVLDMLIVPQPDFAELSTIFHDAWAAGLTGLVLGLSLGMERDMHVWLDNLLSCFAFPALRTIELYINADTHPERPWVRGEDLLHRPVETLVLAPLRTVTAEQVARRALDEMPTLTSAIAEVTISCHGSERAVDKATLTR